MLAENCEVADQKKGKGGRPPEKELNAFGKWIMASGLTRAVVAEDLETTVQHLGRLMSDEQRPSLELAFKIEKYTDGAISAKSWVESEL
jgi:hypothetical protein